VSRSHGNLADMAAAALRRWPQVLRNVAVADRDGLAEATAVWEEVQRAERSLGRQGRVLLRPSGTEPLVRVMVEAPTQEAAEAAAERIVSALHIALGGATGS
jgi:phosphoglucosamine mutase